jgi:hypothetical protein
MLNPIPMLISRKVLMALFLIPLLCSANIYAQSEIVQTDNIRSNTYHQKIQRKPVFIPLFFLEQGSFITKNTGNYLLYMPDLVP